MYFGTNSRVSAESTTFQRNIAVMAFVKGSVYTITFRADSVLSEVNAEERMGRFQPLAMRVLSVMTLDSVHQPNKGSRLQRYRGRHDHCRG